MKTTQIIEGVVAEYNGKYWGVQYEDGHCEENDFGKLEDAKIGDPKYCTAPTDFTHGFGRDYLNLKKARLVKVRKTIITEFEIIP